MRKITLPARARWITEKTLIAFSVALAMTGATMAGETEQRAAAQIAMSVTYLAMKCPQARVNHTALGIVMTLAGIDDTDLTAGGPVGAAAIRTWATMEDLTEGMPTAKVCALARAAYGPQGSQGAGMMEFN